MSMVTLTLAWVLVAVLFVGAAVLGAGRVSRAIVAIAAAESAALTLLGALWFGTVGHGDWPLVFLLLGLLIAGPQRMLRSAILRSAEPFDGRGFVLDLVRYLVAGALLAWRLG